MSVYALQKMIRDVNRLPEKRQAYFSGPATFAATYDISEEERAAFVDLDVTKLYAMGVHGLLLRPFTILHKMSEPDYLTKIRATV